MQGPVPVSGLYDIGSSGRHGRGLTREACEVINQADCLVGLRARQGREPISRPLGECGVVVHARLKGRTLHLPVEAFVTSVCLTRIGCLSV
jgi:hypothetical protein